MDALSLSVWRVWIEIDFNNNMQEDARSLSVWRVWIEIFEELLWFINKHRHSLYGECGLKYLRMEAFYYSLGHSLYGECGLKYVYGAPKMIWLMVTLCMESVD